MAILEQGGQDREQGGQVLGHAILDLLSEKTAENGYRKPLPFKSSPSPF
jgi:hypothetical protein